MNVLLVLYADANVPDTSAVEATCYRTILSSIGYATVRWLDTIYYSVDRYIYVTKKKEKKTLSLTNITVYTFWTLDFGHGHKDYNLTCFECFA